MALIRPNKAKQKLQNGEAITVVSGLQTSDIIDYLGPIGFDAAWIECEHGSVDWDALGDMTRACDLWEMASVTRVNSNDAGLITRTLDRGSMGIVVPHVNSKEAAEQAAQSTKYSPQGYRGMFGGRQSFGVGDYFHQANDQTMVVVLLEEAEALANLDEILTVPDIDVYFVAPSDLSQTMGHIGNAGHPDVLKAIDEAIAKITGAGKVAGTLVTSGSVEEYQQKGVQFLMTPWVAWVGQGGAEFVKKVGSPR